MVESPGKLFVMLLMITLSIGLGLLLVI